MSLSNGKQFLMIPGPTNVPDEVLRAMHRPAIDIYDGPLENVTATCLEGLGKAFRTDGHVYIYAANGHGAWDAATSNVFSRGDKVLVLDSGPFTTGWAYQCRLSGLDADVLPGSYNGAFDPAFLEARLRQDTAHQIKAVLCVQVETANGIANDIPALRKAIDASGHPALYVVDTIASLGCLPFEMDGWGVDLAVSASQKGLMCPPGLAFVAAGPKALKAHETADLRTGYMDWTFRQGPMHWHKYCGTPPEQQLFALEAALDILLNEGLEAVWHRHALLADATRAAAKTWSEGGAISFNVGEPDARSDSLTVLRIDGCDPAQLLAFTRDVCGVTVGQTIGNLAGLGIRIAHMGHVNAAMLLGTLSALELGMKQLAIPHGEGGVQAAISSLNASL